MANYTEHFCPMDDGINVYYRDYGDRASLKTPVICIPGLTRSSQGFHNLASDLSADRRVICVDLRGRGKSDYDENYENYTPQQYVKDVAAVLKHAAIEKVVIIGTSLGGVIAMTGAATFGDLLAGVVLNDVGPVVNPAGLQRIQNYVGQLRAPETWEGAVDLCKQTNGMVYPDYSEENWSHYARCLFGTDENGSPMDYFDPNISKSFATPVAGDMWPAYEQLYRVPVSVIRGEISDILSQGVAEDMSRRHPNAALFRIRKVGHTPDLDEAESRAGIQRLLEKVDQ
jgi:pimeloyl-ACP methyl ester carboxylesterase